jgi:hypothetical protein
MMGTSGCAYTYKGRVIDAGTKEPIEGAAVVVYWYKEKGYFIETVQKLKNVKETLTDENGEWAIKGPKGHDIGHPFYLMISHIPFIYYTWKPSFIVFKPGYCSVPKPASLLAACKEMKFHGGEGFGHGMTVELPRLTKRGHRRLASMVGPIGSGKKWRKKQKEFIRLLNKTERVYKASQSIKKAFGI